MNKKFLNISGEQVGQKDMSLGLKNFEVKRQEGKIYKEDLEFIRELWEKDQDKARIMAISLLEYIFCDQISTDDKEINKYFLNR